MGYLTDYELCAEPITEEVYEKINAVMTQEAGFERMDFCHSVGYWSMDGETWYDHERDLMRISAQYPKVLFTLYGTGEVWDDIWKKHFLNGKVQDCPAVITYAPLRKDRMSDTETWVMPEGMDDERMYRQYEIDDAVYQCVRTILGKNEREFPWDAACIQSVTAAVWDVLTDRGYMDGETGKSSILSDCESDT